MSFLMSGFGIRASSSQLKKVSFFVLERLAESNVVGKFDILKRLDAFTRKFVEFCVVL